jgi:hypothetical protein
MTLLFPGAHPQARSLANEESHSINHILFQHSVFNTIQLAAQRWPSAAARDQHSS